MINFSQVKDITIPEGSVLKITDSNGTILWQKITKALDSITLSGQTTSLDRGSAFSFGGTVTAHYTDNTTADVTNDTTFSGYNMSTSGTYTVTATYTEDGITKTATYSLTVNKAWTEVWSGSKSISWDLSKTTVPSAVPVFDKEYSSNPNIRVTFTMSNKRGKYGEYCVDDGHWSTSLSKPSSPHQYSSLDVSIGAHLIIGVSGCNNNSSGIKGRISLQYYNAGGTKRYVLRANNAAGSTAYSGTISLTVTKIEEYY